LDKSTSNPMTAVYDRLQDLGLSRAYVRQAILPSWWDDDASLSPAGFAEALMLISRHAGVRVADLRTGNVPFSPAGPVTTTRFKLSKGASEEDVALAQRLATQTARVACAGVVSSPKPVPSASEIRGAIIEGGASSVGLDSLLDYCWGELGLPVLHVSNFPHGARKMEGLSAVVEGRPVVVISKSSKQPAWLLFILAHEIGHLSLRHIKDGEVLVDTKVESSSSDKEESQANRFAEELLCGEAGRRFVPSGRWPNARVLAAEAQSLGRKYQIDPGHIVLNYASTMGESFFRVGNAALSFIDPAPDAIGAISRKLDANLDWSALPEEAAEFITRMTGILPAKAA
jgi:hypothetical protein